MQSKLTSIAMATYNGEKYLREQLDSIYAQTYKNIEVIVCDDCSSDKTVEILKEYSERFGLKYFINEKNLGYVKNFEKAISLCNGEYIALSDQDDIWLENKLDILLNEIDDNLLIHSDCELIDEFGNSLQLHWKSEINSHKNFEDFLFSNLVTGCTILFKKGLLKGIAAFPDGLAYHDWYLGILAAKEKKIKYLNKSLIQYRQHSHQDTGSTMPTLFEKIFTEKIDRLIGKEIHRQKVSTKQLLNLRALQSNNTKSIALDEAIEYFSSYLNSFFHIKMFLVGIKYSKYIYSQNNPFFIKNIIYDVIG